MQSAASDEVRALLAKALIIPLATHLGASRGDGEHWRTRTALTLAILAGFDLLRRVLKVDALNRAGAKALLERAVRPCLVDIEGSRAERSSEGPGKPRRRGAARARGDRADARSALPPSP